MVFSNTGAQKWGMLIELQCASESYIKQIEDWINFEKEKTTLKNTSPKTIHSNWIFPIFPAETHSCFPSITMHRHVAMTLGTTPESSGTAPPAPKAMRNKWFKEVSIHGTARDGWIYTLW